MGALEYGSGNMDISTENGNVLDSNDVERIFIYYLVVNHVLGVVNGLAQGEPELENKLLTKFRGAF